MYKFTYKYNPEFGDGLPREIEVKVDTPHAGLAGILEVFEDYLRAVGFRFNGTLDIVEDEDET